MEFREFCVWCANTFGADGDTDQFATDMNELILKVAQPQTQRGNEHPADMSDTKTKAREDDTNAKAICKTNLKKTS